MIIKDKIKKQPINNIKWVHIDQLKANDYNPNHVFKKEFELITRSILENGWLHPILINKDNIIIDGYHRATILKRNKKIYELTGGYLPCIILNLSNTQTKLLTIRINRAKGTHTAYKMAEVIKELNVRGLQVETIAKEIGATKDEINLLLEEDIFTKEKFNNESLYSQAWTPQK